MRGTGLCLGLVHAAAPNGSILAPQGPRVALHEPDSNCRSNSGVLLAVVGIEQNDGGVKCEW